jgi:hypothetical protein
MIPDLRSYYINTFFYTVQGRDSQTEVGAVYTEVNSVRIDSRGSKGSRSIDLNESLNRATLLSVNQHKIFISP